ncbi:MAG: ATP-binding cassette domain-containing protein [Pikeienuella sp.]|uniref:ATP-binding cassette domain-containing protein n=1 Tax=Pikeienuella sp. TaxID=2831957 RepID=UPI00391CDE17
MAERGLRLERLEITREGRRLVSLDTLIGSGEALTVMGPSGSGKSTLLAAIAGAPPPGFSVSGRVLLDGRDVTALPPEARRIGILFQEELLFPHLSVGANLAFGLRPHVKGRAARRARVERALVEAGLEGMAERDPATLSGGQKARAALMRMLLSEPAALLLDEAFSRLDAALRDQIRALVFDTARREGLPLLQVTHDEADAAAAGGRIVRL